MAWMDPYTGPFGTREAGHLARRTQIGARPAEIAALASLGLDGALSAVVDYPAADAAYDALVATFPTDTSDLGRVRNPRDFRALAGSWLHRLVHTANPLQEHLTLFLHDTLVSDFPKVVSYIPVQVDLGNDGSTTGQLCTNGTLTPETGRRFALAARLLADQVALYRATGHLSYNALIKAVTRDPAMLLYLDNAVNTRQRPQENYGREVMELFTMGVGNYTENDVKEASRAFTGETVNRTCQGDFSFAWFFQSAAHDTNSKTLFGTTFNNGAGDTDFAIDLMFDRVSGSSISPAHGRLPATALYLSWKLITWFVHEDIPITHEAVEELAEVFDATSVSGYRHDMRETLRTLLRSQLFFDAAWYYRMVRHPVEFLAGALRALELEETSYSQVAPDATGAMGMMLYQAPNVAGWDHGRAWTNSGSLIARHNYADRLSTPGIMTDAAVDRLLSEGHVASFADDAGLVDYFRARLVHDPLRPEEQQELLDFCAAIDAGAPSLARFRRKARGLVHLTLALPRCQLK